MAWPHTLTTQQLSFASAALRHAHDAESLVTTSPVQSYYLAGYGPECVRKAVLTFPDAKALDQMHLAIGHGVEASAETAWTMTQGLDPMARRHGLAEMGKVAPKLKGWKVDVRYGRSDSITVQTARTLTDQTKELVINVMTSLWTDGRVPSLSALVAVKP